jgi:hypothetical protein
MATMSSESTGERDQRSLDCRLIRAPRSAADRLFVRDSIEYRQAT